MSITIELHGGSTLEAEKVSGGGYIAAPIGAIFLGAPAPAPELTGHYVLIVTYLDGQRGLISQDQILAIRDQYGVELPFGSPRFPGHPDYDPRNQPTLEQQFLPPAKKIGPQKIDRRTVFDFEQLPEYYPDQREDSTDDDIWPDWR